MAMCPQCEGEMMEEISCLSEPIPIGGDFFEPIRWGDEKKRSRWVIDFPCRDCRTPVGGVHHPGCCMERCPACLGQALGCPCFGTDDDVVADFLDDGEEDDVTRNTLDTGDGRDGRRRPRPRATSPPMSASASGAGRTSFTATFGGKRPPRSGCAIPAEDSGPGLLAPGNGRPPQARPARVQCVDTRARRDWRRDPIVAMTALGS